MPTEIKQKEFRIGLLELCKKFNIPYSSRKGVYACTTPKGNIKVFTRVTTDTEGAE